MRAILRRLLAIETVAKKSLGTRHFWGYEETGKFYECGSRPDYRRGLAGEDGDGPTFTRSDLAELERQGWEVTTITLKFVSDLDW